MTQDHTTMTQDHTTTFRTPHLILCTALMSLCPVAAQAAVTFIDVPNLDFRIATVTGININGTTYDATFHHGVTFNSLPDPAITFNNSLDASVAAAAINAEILASATVAGNNDQTNTYYIPFSFVPANVEAYQTFRTNSFPLTFVGIGNTNINPATVNPPRTIDAWVLFASSSSNSTPVPEPSTGLMKWISG
jgi:hypothetical protein